MVTAIARMSDAPDMAEAPALQVPPLMDTVQAAAAGRFLIMGDRGNLWFEGQGGSDTLVISFDNLATIDEGWPRAPWAFRRLEPMGHAVLGVQSHAKDWFRQPTSPAQLVALRDAGFFARFRRIVLTGASMGGFAALNFAPLIPGPRVLAFSAQSTMNKVIAPFEARFPFAVRKSDWGDAPFLDAAAAIPYIARAALLFDPFVPEDKAHAARMRGPNVEQIACPHATHEAIRVILKSGTFPLLIDAMVRDEPLGAAFWAAYRARRTVPKWQRALISNAAAMGHHKLVIAACNRLLALTDGETGEDRVFLRRSKRAALAALQAK